MKDTKGKMAFAILCCLFGIIVSTQFKLNTSTKGQYLYTNRSMRTAIELRDLRSEKERLNRQLTELENRLIEYKEFEADDNRIIKNLKRDLDRFQFLSGYRTVEGPGVTIYLDEIVYEDSRHSFIMMNYEIILALINVLNSASAEAISINDIRYMSTTEIYYTFNNVMINALPTSPPYTIRAIGNPDTLEAALNMRHGIIWNLRQEQRLQVRVEKNDHIIIPRHDTPITFRYARPIEASQ